MTKAKSKNTSDVEIYPASIKFPCSREEYSRRVVAKAKEHDKNIGALILELFDQLEHKKAPGK